MASRRSTQKAREEELRALWEKYQIDPGVARRAQELADQGRWSEHEQLVVEYLRNHTALMAAVQYGRDHPGEAVPWRELQKKRRRGRKRI